MNGKVFINSICGRCVHIDVCDSHKDNRLKCGCFLEERPRGKWISQIYETIEYYQCSVCKMLVRKNNILIALSWKYCPNCGSPMISSNSEIEKSKSEIVPDYRDGWKLKEGERND